VRVPLNFGIAGFGAMGRWHAAAVKQLPGLKLHSVFDITPACRKDAEREIGCPTYGDLKAFLQDDALDAVVIATPSHAHVEPTLAALQAGKAVLCEKPITRTEREAQRLFDAAEKHQRPLMTFQNRRYDGHYRLIQKITAGGDLGEILDVRISDWVFSDLMRTFGVKSFRPGWRSEAAYGGGVLLDFGPHYCDQVLQLVPQPLETVYAVLKSRRWSQDAEDQFLVVLNFAGGVTATIEVMHAAFVRQPLVWRINGTNGGLRVADGVGELVRASGNGRVRTAQRKQPVEDWHALYRNLRDVLKGKAKLAVQPRETLRLMRTLDAVRKSATNGRVVAVDDTYAPRRRRARAAAAS
jgi:scyllo-inositol 2-dehydrogenase (NADP+)